MPSIRLTYGDGNCLYHAIAQCGYIKGTVINNDKNPHEIYEVSYEQNTMKNIDKIYKHKDLGSHDIVESEGPITVSSLQHALLNNKILQNSDRVSEQDKKRLKDEDKELQKKLDEKINSFKDKLAEHVQKIK